MPASYFEGNEYICEYIHFAVNATWKKKFLPDHFMCYFLFCIFKSAVPYTAW